MKKRLSFLSMTLFLLLLTDRAEAYKLDFLAGGFSLSAQTSSSSGSISNLGAYKISYLVPVTNHFEFGLGYTLIMSDVVSGDAAFGLDLDLNYFPISANSALELRTGNTSARMTEKWAPLIGVGFHQRQFQSVQTQYNGFSISGGAERALVDQFSLKAIVRYMYLNGASGATANLIDALVGVSFQF